jgi:alkylhydroperoxidase family enzyme
MGRLRGVPRDEVTSQEILDTYQVLFDDRDPTVEPGTATGTPGDWWTVFALDPDLFHIMRLRQKWQYSPERKLDPGLREAALARTGWVVGSQFVFSQHCKGMRNAGHSDEKVAAIPTWSTASTFDWLERLVLAYTDDLVAGGRVPEERAAALRNAISELEMLELTFMVTTYVGSAIISRALRMEYDDRDDPIVEVPSPPSLDAGTFARMHNGVAGLYPDHSGQRPT